MSDDAVPTVRAILVHYRAADWCRSAVASLLASTGAAVDVVVVDNSGDLDGLPSSVRVIRPGGNVGYAGGMNVGLREWLSDSGDLCLVGAHDLHVEPTTVSTLIETAERHPDFGILAPWFTPRVARVNERGESDGIVEFEWVSGSGFLLRRACIEEIGLFDEDFGSYVEDHELCARAGDHGWRVGAVRSAAAATRGSAHPDRAVVMMHGNEILMAAKRGRRADVRSRFAAEFRGVGTQIRRAASPRHSTRAGLRRAWLHLRSAEFGARQIVTWRIRTTTNSGGRP